MTEDVMTDADLKPLQDDIDHRFAGDSLEPWVGYVPDESLLTAINVAAERPGERIIAFVYPQDNPRGDFRPYVERQRRAGKVYVAENLPHLKVTFRVLVAPFRGIGKDVRVFFVVVGPEKKHDS